MAFGITDSSLMHHLQNAKAHGVTKAEIAARGHLNPLRRLHPHQSGKQRLLESERLHHYAGGWDVFAVNEYKKRRGC